MPVGPESPIFGDSKIGLSLSKGRSKPESFAAPLAALRYGGRGGELVMISAFPLLTFIGDEEEAFDETR
jgi:hypothetical protein